LATHSPFKGIGLAVLTGLLSLAHAVGQSAHAQDGPSEPSLACEATTRADMGNALRSALTYAAAPGGLPEPHALNITFKTAVPGVSLPAYLAAQYPDEMTVILQYQYRDLSLGKSRFEVTLSFKGRPERVSVPYAAVTTFSDPASGLCRFYSPDAASQAVATL